MLLAVVSLGALSSRFLSKKRAYNAAVCHRSSSLHITLLQHFVPLMKKFSLLRSKLSTFASFCTFSSSFDVYQSIQSPFLYLLSFISFPSVPALSSLFPFFPLSFLEHLEVSATLLEALLPILLL